MVSKFLRNIQSAPVTAEMLEEVSIALDEAVREGDGKLIDDPMWIIFRTFKAREIDPFTLTAIMFRMQALSDMIAAGKITEWQLPGTDGRGAVTISANVFHAAANARLILSNQRGVPPKFLLQEFNKLALAAAEPQGRA
ncbi:hypothetical protein [Ensifer aridi]|uniref:hypothetical protein n=1 Tax=Ensifer aridi TaxID=1708715 RepID=UPI000A107A76|nr:hypothetical protein [Ensifer aridi]